jgi:hypothetical protein
LPEVPGAALKMTLKPNPDLANEAFWKDTTGVISGLAEVI